MGYSLSLKYVMRNKMGTIIVTLPLATAGLTMGHSAFVKKSLYCPTIRQKICEEYELAEIDG